MFLIQKNNNKGVNSQHFGNLLCKMLLNVWIIDTGIIHAFCCLDPKSEHNNEQLENRLEHFGTSNNADDTKKNAAKSSLGHMINDQT